MACLPILRQGTGVVLTIMGKSGKTLAEDAPDIPWILKKLLDVVDAVYKWRASRWGIRYEHANTQFTKEDSVRIESWIKEGKLKPIIGGVVGMDDLEGVKKVFGLVATGKGAVGNYVVKI